MARKLIGIPAFRNDQTFGCGLNHIEFMNTFGDIRLIMPHEDFVKVDLLYLPGGMDLNPASYGEVPGYKTQHTDVFKQYFYDYRLKNYVNNNIPIFGVCLGFQMIASYFGSKLTQHFNFHPQSKDRWQEAHEITTNDGQVLKVNSHHHQGILLQDLNLPLQALAIYQDLKEGTIVEALSHNELPIIGVAYHPEELYDFYSKQLIEQLLERGN